VLTERFGLGIWQQAPESVREPLPSEPDVETEFSDVDSSQSEASSLRSSDLSPSSDSEEGEYPEGDATLAPRITVSPVTPPPYVQLSPLNWGTLWAATQIRLQETDSLPKYFPGPTSKYPPAIQVDHQYYITTRIRNFEYSCVIPNEFRRVHSGSALIVWNDRTRSNETHRFDKHRFLKNSANGKYYPIPDSVELAPHQTYREWCIQTEQYEWRGPTRTWQELLWDPHFRNYREYQDDPYKQFPYSSVTRREYENAYRFQNYWLSEDDKLERDEILAHIEEEQTRDLSIRDLLAWDW